MFDEQKFMEEVGAVDTGNYGMDQREMSAIYSAGNGDWFHSIKWAFQFGFLKGQRAETARRRKAAKK